MAQILAQWQVAYLGFCEEKTAITDTIKEATYQLSGAPSPYKGWNPWRRYQEGKAHIKFTEDTKSRIQNAEKRLIDAQREIGQKTQILFGSIFPSDSPAVAAIQDVAFKEDAFRTSASKKKLVERALRELAEAQEEIGGASDYELLDMIGNNPAFSVLSHFETEEAAEGLGKFKNTLKQVAEQLGDNSVHKPMGDPTEGWAFDVDLFAGLANFTMLSTWTSFLNMHKLDEVAEQLKALKPQLQELDDALAKEVARHTQNLAQAHEDCVSRVLYQIDQSVEVDLASLLKNAVHTIPAQILFSKNPVFSNNHARPDAQGSRGPSFDRKSTGLNYGE